jgi:hypothetical protein
MTIVRQFQLHQTEMKSLLQSFLSKEKDQEEQIRKLQA